MHHHYEDITKRIADKPKWYDENAVPRYCAFRPDECADIYADEVAFVLIACQACRTQFKVAMTTDMMQPGRFDTDGTKLWPLAEAIRDGSLHFGDPPNAGCCGAGASMNCDDIRVLEYWRKDRLDWKRDTSLERPLADADRADE